MPKIGTDGKNLIVIDTRPFGIRDPIKIPLEQVKELLRKNKNKQ